MVDAEAVTWQRAASSRASSGPLHRDSGTPDSAGSAHASATASARSAAVNTGGRPLRGASFSPASRLPANRRRHLRTVSRAHPQLPGDRGVGLAGGRGQHDLTPAAGRGRPAHRPGPGRQHGLLLVGQDNQVRARHRHLIFVPHPRAGAAARHAAIARPREDGCRGQVPGLDQDVPGTAPARPGPRTLAPDHQPADPPPRRLQLRRRDPGRRHHAQAVPAALRRLRPPWQFAIYRASHDDYDESVFPTGLPVGTCQDALDTACGLYLNDPTAWT